MIVDSSAVVAIVLSEERSIEIEEKLSGARTAFIPAPMVLECFIVLSGRSVSDVRTAIWRPLLRMGVRELEFSSLHRQAAEQAFERFGKGHHAARLNFGDCMAYAVAKVEGLPLLYAGDDFAKTDIESA